jgi:hypothetical protein
MPESHPDSTQQMQRWRPDDDLAGVRDKGRLARLPAEERTAWARLWSDVSELLAHAKEPSPRDKETPDKP